MRASAAPASFKIGPAANDAAAALEAAIQDRDSKVRAQAAKALARVRG